MLPTKGQELQHADKILVDFYFHILMCYKYIIYLTFGVTSLIFLL